MITKSSPVDQVFAEWVNLDIEARRKLVKERDLGLQWVELPVDLETFVSRSPLYLNHLPLSDIQLEAVYESSDLFDIDAAREDPTRVVFRADQKIESVIMWGKGSGKDLCAGIMMARILYLLGCLTSPQGVFGMPVYSGIDMLNMAVNASQAHDEFFAPLKRMLASSQWFMQRIGMVFKVDSLHLPPKLGTDEHGNDMYSVNGWSGSGSHESFEGKNLLACVLDEIDAFRQLAFMQGENRYLAMATTAETMYDAMTASVQSRFPGIGKMVLLSWPRFYGSFIMRQLKAGKGDPRVFTSGPFATWEVNPRISEADLEDEKRRNPERYRAKYMAAPGMSIERFFTMIPPLLETFHAELTTDWEVSRSVSDPGPEPPVSYEDMRVMSLPPADPGGLYCWHIDLGLTKDRAAIAMSHHVGFVEDVAPSEVDDGDGYGPRLLPVISLDLVYWWKAKSGGEIQFSSVRAFIIDMARRGYTTVSVTIDGWQSIDTRQILKQYDQHGYRVRIGRDGKPTRTPIEVETFSLDAKPVGYETLRELIYDPSQRLKAFYCQLLVEELLGLIDIQGGKKIDHPDGGSKDVSDATAGSVYGALRHLRDDLFVPAYRSRPGQVFVGVSGYEPEKMAESQERVSRAMRRMPRAFG